MRKTKIKDFETIHSPYFFLKNTYSEKGALGPGFLKGNEFTILVRTDSSFSKKIFIENFNKISKEGFYNFFYLQRFGTPRLINFYWGLFILKGEYQKTILSYLCSPGKREIPYFINLRKEIRKNFGDWQKIEEVLNPFPIIFQNERKIITYLKNNPKDFIGALNQIPEQVQLWLFAYASLLFNKKLSSFLKRGVEPPPKLPLILSDDKKEWLYYEELLGKDGIASIPFQYLKPFPYVRWQKREIKIKERVKILNFRIVPEGVILNFSLPKAAYATTFLAHLFNLVSGVPPKDFSSLSIDTKATLGKESIEEVLNRFSEIIQSKTENILKRLS